MLETFIRLRLDAIERGFQEAAIAYGWTAIRLTEERLAADYARLGVKWPYDARS